MDPLAGDAVNPSMGAWPRHPCRGHPRNRTHSAFDSFPLLSEWHELLLVGVDLGRHDEHGNDRNRILWSRAVLDCAAWNMLDASADNGEDGGWFFWLALHGATHP